MTHDELLAKINYDIEGNPFDEYMSALRAVVELHKPSGTTGLGYPAYCHQCMENNGTGEIKNLVYPCPTIQAIEKELG